MLWNFGKIYESKVMGFIVDLYFYLHFVGGPIITETHNVNFATGVQ